MAAVFIGIGSNLGNRLKNITTALNSLRASSGIKVIAVSALRETTPYKCGGPDYLNAVAKLDTDLEPEELLEVLQEIEHRLGRKRPRKGAPRTIDLDILFYENRAMDTPRLTIPHPRILEREFVMEPLLEIEPDFNPKFALGNGGHA